MGTHHWDTKKVELKHARDGPLKVMPGGCVVSQPMGCKLARSRKGGTGYNEASLIREHSLDSSRGGERDLGVHVRP